MKTEQNNEDKQIIINEILRLMFDDVIKAKEKELNSQDLNTYLKPLLREFKK